MLRKIKKIDTLPIVFNYAFLFGVVFIFVLFIGLMKYKIIGIGGSFDYLILSFLFYLPFLLLFFISLNYQKNCNKQEISISKKELFLARILFVIGQIYYIKLPYIFLANGGFSGLYLLRFEIKKSLNVYFGSIAFVFCIIGITYELVAACNNNKKNIRNYVKFYMMLIFLVIEQSLTGSRSLLFVLFFILTFILIRMKKISIFLISICSFFSIFIFGFIGYLRIASDPSVLLWWVDNGYFNENDSVFSMSLAIIINTVSDIFYRGYSVVNGVFNGDLGLKYGYVSFFFLMSALPGVQEDPSIYLNQYFFQGSYDDVAYPPTLIGQLIWDFGLYGVFLGSIVLALCGFFLLKMSLNSSSPIFTVIYSLFVIQLLLSVYGVFNFGWFIANTIAFLVVTVSMRFIVNKNLI